MNGPVEDLGLQSESTSAPAFEFGRKQPKAKNLIVVVRTRRLGSLRRSQHTPPASPQTSLRVLRASA